MFYVVAMQTKSHKEAFAIIFFISVGIFSTASETFALIILSLSNISNSQVWLYLHQKRLALAILKRVNAKLLGQPQKFRVDTKIKLNAGRVSRLSFRFL